MRLDMVCDQPPAADVGMNAAGLGATMNGKGESIAATANPNGVMRLNVTLTNPQGLHMRPAAAFAKLAREFSGSVHVIHAGRSVNGKSPLDLLLLAAEPGAELILEAAGPGAERILKDLADVLAQPVTDDD